MSAGKLLAGARAARKLTVTEVAARLRLNPAQVEALEADAYERLPGVTFTRGIIRSYARLLQIDPQPVLDAFLAHGPQPGAARIRVPSENIRFRPRGTRRTRHLSRAALVAIVLAAAAAGWYGLGRPPSDTPSSLQPGTWAPEGVAVVPLPQPVGVQPQPEDAVPQGAATGRRGVIRFEFEAQSWVEVRDASGAVIFSQTSPPGSVREVSGTPPLSVVVGNADGVRIIYNSAPYDLAPHTRLTVARFTLE